MAQSVGQIALDIVMGKNTVTSTISSAMSECQKVMSDSTASMGNKVSALGNTVTTMGAAIAPASAAVTAFGVTAFNAASSFEDAMAKVSTIADTTQVPLDDLESAILELSDQTGVSASEIADNVYNAISAGQETGDAVNFVSNATKLATAGFTDSASALDILSTVLNSYGMEASEVTDVSDMLIQTQNLGKTTVGELASSMGKVIPTANAYGVGLDNICASYAIMTSNGVATAESTTYVNGMLNELGKSGTQVSDILKDQTGQSFGELMASGASLGDVLGILQQYCTDTGTQFSDLWSSAEAGKAALILAKDGADGFNGTLGEMQASTGMTDSAFEKMQTTSYDMKKAMNELKNTMIDLGGSLMEALGPTIQSVCDKIKDFSTWFKNLDDDTKNIIVTVGLFVAALGPVLIVIGKVISSVGTIISAGSAVVTFVTGTLWPAIMSAGSAVVTFITGTLWPAIMSAGSAVVTFITGTMWPAISGFFAFLAANPIILIITAIIAVGALLITHWEQVKEVASAVWQGICNVITTVWGGIKIAITTAINAIKNVVTTVFTAISTFISTVLNTIKNTVNNVWNAIKTAITTVINAIHNTIVSVWTAITSFVSSVVNGIKNTVVNVFTSMKNGVSSVISGVKNAIVNGLNAAFTFIKGIPSQALQWGKDMIQGLIDGVKSMIGKVGDAVKGVADKITGFLHFSVPDEGPLTKYESWMPDFMSGLASGITGNAHLVTGALQDLTSDMSINPALNVQAPQLSNISTGSMQEENRTISTFDKLDRLITLMEKYLGDEASGDVTIPVYIGNELVDEYISNRNNRKTIRSGGYA